MANVHIRGGEQSCKSESLQKLKKNLTDPKLLLLLLFLNQALKTMICVQPLQIAQMLLENLFFYAIDVAYTWCCC